MPNPIGFILLAALAACSFGGGEEGDGVAPKGSGTTRSYDVTGFTGVKLAGVDDVDVRVGPAFSVRAEGPTEVLDRLRIERDGDMLSVGRKRGVNMGRSSGAAKIFVTMPSISDAALAGTGDLTVDRVQGEAFRGSLAGTGSLSLRGLAVRRVAFDLAGSGDLTAAGRTDRLEVNLAGSGNIDARALTAGQGSVSLAGSGDVSAVVNGPATVNLMGSGDVDLGSGARCTVRKMGSGSVRCGSQ
jgi:hypothetical protein